MHLADALTLDTPRRTGDGYMAVRARAAKAGIYHYSASEVRGAPSTFKLTDTVIVYRDEAEVFAQDSVASFLARPITNDHPAEAVTANNWRDHARGAVMGAMRDGEYLAFDLVLMDAAAIADVESGKRELSNGYSCQLDWTPGTAPDGTVYDARQTHIRGNHVALVDKGRAGSECRIGDAAIGDGGNADKSDMKFAICDANPAAIAALSEGVKMSKTITIDGLPVSLGDEAAVIAVLAKKDAAIADGEKALAAANAAHDKAMAAKDAEIDDLKSKVIDQAAIDALADAKASVVAKAKGICGDKLPETAGKSVAEVRRMACDAKGVSVADKSDDYIEARFDALTADAKADNKVVSISPARAVNDAAALSNARNARNAAIAGLHRA